MTVEALVEPVEGKVVAKRKSTHWQGRLSPAFMKFLIYFYGAFLGTLWVFIFLGFAYCIFYMQPGVSAIWNPKTALVARFSLFLLLVGSVGLLFGLVKGLRHLSGLGWRIKIVFSFLAIVLPAIVLFSSVALLRVIIKFVWVPMPI